MLELLEEDSDPSLLTEIKSSLTDLDDQVTEAEFKALLSGKNDFSNAFVAINSGAGGTAVSYTHLTLPTTPYV